LDGGGRGLKFAVNETPFHYTQRTLSIADCRQSSQNQPIILSLPEKAAKMSALKKLLLKRALRRAQKRLAEADKEMRIIPHFMPGFDDIRPARGRAHLRCEELAHKPAALKYK